MIRLIIFLVVGSLLAVVGAFVGLSSHQVVYRDSGHEVVAHFLSDDRPSSNHIGYLQMVNDPNLYIINENNFAPVVNGQSFGDGDTIAFLYRSDDPTNIKVNATNTGTHLEGPAYSIERLTVVSSPGGPQNPKVYASAEYTQNPNGFFQNNWLLGGGLLAVGILFVIAGLVLQMLSKNRKSIGAGQQLSPRMGIPAQQPQSGWHQQVHTPAPQYQFGPQTPYQPPFSPQPGLFPPLQGATPYNQPAQQPRPQFQPRPGQYGSPQGPVPYNQPVQYPQYPPQQDQR